MRNTHGDRLSVPCGRGLCRRRDVAREQCQEDGLVGLEVAPDLDAGSCPRGGLAGDGLKAWAQVVERGYGDLVAKDPASPYRGGRTLAWLKVKVPHYREVERGLDARPAGDRR